MLGTALSRSEGQKHTIIAYRRNHLVITKTGKPINGGHVGCKRLHRAASNRVFATPPTHNFRTPKMLADHTVHQVALTTPYLRAHTRQTITPLAWNLTVYETVHSLANNGGQARITTAPIQPWTKKHRRSSNTRPAMSTSTSRSGTAYRQGQHGRQLLLTLESRRSSSRCTQSPWR